MKKQNGITLIALIITIIVMLILVGVSVTVALNGGLFSTAEQAKEGTKVERDKELALSGGQVEINGEVYDSIDDYTKGWKQNGTTVTKGGAPLTVGETVTNYTAGGYTWQVLGAEGGKLLLTTSTTVGDAYTITATADKWDSANQKWTAIENELNELFSTSDSEYYIDKGVNAERIRSIKVEDINRVTGYNPIPDAGQYYGYTFTVISGDKLPNGVDASTLLTMNNYYYDTYDWIDIDSNPFIMLFGDQYSPMEYWLASSFVSEGMGNAIFGLRLVTFIGERVGRIDSAGLWNTDDGAASTNNSFNVRPVVVLSYDFVPEV